MRQITLFLFKCSGEPRKTALGLNELKHRLTLSAKWQPCCLDLNVLISINMQSLGFNGTNGGSLK